jgi:hypothetical protein
MVLSRTGVSSMRWDHANLLCIIDHIWTGIKPCNLRWVFAILNPGSILDLILGACIRALVQALPSTFILLVSS